MEIDDAAFDALLTQHARLASRDFWTPAAVARRAVSWIEEAGASRVLDVGSGVGKFCVLAAAASPERMRFTGVERRGRLVVEARFVAAQLGVAARVDFVHGGFTELDLAAYDALYLYNPFSEHVFSEQARLDASVELSFDRMKADIAALEAALDAMRVGGVLVTYHGFRGAVPDTFDLLRWEQIGDCMLRCWRKERERRGGFRWIEVGESLTLAPGEID